MSRFTYCYAECGYAECGYAECGYAECRYAECGYAECRYAECRYAECHGATETSHSGKDTFLNLMFFFEKLCLNTRTRPKEL